jgi:phospho-N-acetylmuramoyl-pentapeptide-transferase
MSQTVIMSVVISFAISVILGPFIIPFLRKLKVGQTVRDDGPQSHLKKSGTPTMGGILILIGIAVTSVIYMKDYPIIIPVLFLTLGFGLVGFLDDYIKVASFKLDVSQSILKNLCHVFLEQYCSL